MPALPVSQPRPEARPSPHAPSWNAATGPKGVSEEKIEAALRQSGGILAHAAEALGLNRTSVEDRVAKSKHLQAVRKELRETVGDLCEGVIFTAIKAKDHKMVRWYSGMHLKDRGYTTRMELTGAEGGAILTETTVTYHFVRPGDEAEIIEGTATAIDADDIPV